VEEARKVVSDVVKNTTLDHSSYFSKHLSCELYLKRENEQRTGSFKMRGATNKMHSLSAEEKQRGVIASSAGNHAQGVALSASLAGVKCVIVMPENAPIVKVKATKDYGAEVIFHGSYYDEASEKATQLAKEKGYVRIHAFEDPYIIAGQGTIALEILEAMSDLDSIVVPIGGGGLIAGIATVIKAKKPKCRVIGVQAENVNNMAVAFHEKAIPKTLRVSPTIADGISVKTPSKYMYENYISKLVDDVVTVSEDDIAEAIVTLLERTKAVVEGSGAASIAAMLKHKLNLGKNSCAVLSGGNIDLNLIEKIIDRGLSRHGRIVQISVIVGDVPGALSRLTDCIANLRGNVLEVSHDRIGKDVALMETRIDFTIETSSFEHVEKIRAAVAALGVKMI